MSNKDLARRSEARISIDGVDVTTDIAPYIISVVYTDNEADEADDLQIKLHDRESLWLKSWVAKMIDKAASSSSTDYTKNGLGIQAVFGRSNWNGDGKDDVLDTGFLEFDDISADGPPSTITIKATSLPFSSQIRQTKKSRAWESYYLSGIVREMATKAGLGYMYLSGTDPYYKRVEQYNTSDISFLSTLCKKAGISLKTTGKMLVCFDQASYEARSSILTITRGSGQYGKYKLHAGHSDTEYASCRVRYTPPSGSTIEGIAYVEDYNENSETNQQLEIKAKVSSIGDAKRLAAKYLRLYNKYAKTVTFNLPGNTGAVAGLTFTLSGWGAFDGKYIIKQSKHTVSKSSGYTTQIVGRAVLPY